MMNRRRPKRRLQRSKAQWQRLWELVDANAGTGTKNTKDDPFFHLLAQELNEISEDKEANSLTNVQAYNTFFRNAARHVGKSLSFVLQTGLSVHGSPPDDMGPSSRCGKAAENAENSGEDAEMADEGQRRSESASIAHVAIRNINEPSKSHLPEELHFPVPSSGSRLSSLSLDEEIDQRCARTLPTIDGAANEFSNLVHFLEEDWASRLVPSIEEISSRSRQIQGCILNGISAYTSVNGFSRLASFRSLPDSEVLSRLLFDSLQGSHTDLLDATIRVHRISPKIFLAAITGAAISQWVLFDSVTPDESIAEVGSLGILKRHCPTLYKILQQKSKFEHIREMGWSFAADQFSQRTFETLKSFYDYTDAPVEIDIVIDSFARLRAVLKSAFTKAFELRRSLELSPLEYEYEIVHAKAIYNSLSMRIVNVDELSGGATSSGQIRVLLCLFPAIFCVGKTAGQRRQLISPALVYVFATSNYTLTQAPDVQGQVSPII